ncbi:MAG: lipid-A-disaccharide synthase [Bacteroidales bacterium]|nr:lipid-A-disaccharide synthase [Bacteroidales bacterium]
MKYFLIAGEASGDLHGSNLIKGIRKADSDAVFRCYGGEKMEAAGGILVKHYRELALMGIWEVIKHIRKFKGFIENCKEEIRNFRPDVLILIDYAGFNLRIAKFGKQEQIPVYYYISPKIWAWGKSRSRKIRRFVERMIVILPFEVDFYRKLGINAEFFGNPVVDEIAGFNRSYHESAEEFRLKHKLTGKPIIALLAGSRKQEIDLCLPPMLEAVDRFPDYQLVLAGAPSVPREYYDRFLKNQDIRLVYDETYPLLKNATAAVVTSGTATLEAALLDVPQVVIYKAGNVTYYLGQLFILLGVIHVKFFSLVNIILERELVKEILQFRITKRIISELKDILENENYRKKITKGYEEIRSLLKHSGVSDRIASSIVPSLNKSNNLKSI